MQSDSTLTSRIVSSYHTFRSTVDPGGNVVRLNVPNLVSIQPAAVHSVENLGNFLEEKSFGWTASFLGCHVNLLGVDAETRGFAMEWSLSVLNDEETLEKLETLG